MDKEIREFAIGLYVDTDSADHVHSTKSSVVSLIQAAVGSKVTLLPKTLEYQ